ncbi:MAG TPA: histidine kinase dimerization/phospho-acceptor domain-containing protein [Myxococcales bacterium]|nr:histidine kinase dimerization/phospho-acceptor domain-containing protein [Myxococcales bacterium]
MEGAADRVLGRPAKEAHGRPLAEVLGVSAAAARQLHDRATPEGAVEHLTSIRGERSICLRLRVLAHGDDRRSALVLNLSALLDGAPPLQISKLASSLCHEIRNPLSSVKMAVQTVARNPGLSDRDKRRLTIANLEIRTMERMLSLLSEYGSDKPPLTETTQVRTLLQEAARLVEAELAERRVQLAFDEEDRDLPPVKADPRRLLPVLAQLLLNVAQGLAPGAQLSIRLRRSGTGAQVLISDPSSAVLPDEQHTLYEPFGSRLARGAGLSLAALRQVMNGHGGQFVAEGTGSPGTLFILTFAG